MDLNALFWGASVDELKQGYVKRGDDFICLLCGEKTTQGIIYEKDWIFYEAERFLRMHIEEAHGSVFETLIDFDKRLTGLTDHQSALMKLFYRNKSDAQIQKEMDIGSASTIRNHRFALKERERQAKVFLVLMELLKERDKCALTDVPPHLGAKMADDRFRLSAEENEKILKTFFPEGTSGALSRFPAKEKQKIAVLRVLAERFEPGETYAEKEVNEILAAADDDFVTLRRYLIEYGFMERKADGSAYWRSSRETQEQEGISMDRRKELIQQYKEMKTVGGVYQVRNTVDGKILVVATPNLRTLNGRNAGGFLNKRLQEDVKKARRKRLCV